MLSLQVSDYITLYMIAPAAQPADQFTFEFASTAHSTSSHFLHPWIASTGQPQPRFWAGVA
jgi:hypothetical protein